MSTSINLTSTVKLAQIHPTRSERSIRRDVAADRSILSSRKISGSWILSRGKEIPKDIVGTAEAARRLGINRRQVQAYCKEGLLPAVKVGGVWLVKLKG